MSEAEAEVENLRTQLQAARVRAPAPEISLDEIRRALADHIRFEVACGHAQTADQLAVIRDHLATLPRLGGQTL